MYQKLFKFNRAFAVAIAILMIAAFLVPELRQTLGLTEPYWTMVYALLLAGAVLTERHLSKLAFLEAAQAVENMSFEELEAQLKAEERARERENNR
jgi:hypothetical protein